MKKKILICTGDLSLCHYVSTTLCQTAHLCQIFFISYLYYRYYVLLSDYFLVPGFFLLPGATEREEQCDGPVGPEQQASDSAGGGEEERRPESEAHTGISRRPQG